jgi:Fe-S-cluster-containing dehydrogenase component
MNPDEAYFQGQTLPYASGKEPHRMHPVGKSSKCTLCVHRVDEGKEPACVAGCPSTAMIFGDLDDPGSPIRRQLWKSEQLLVSRGNNPKVSYIIPENVSRFIEERILENPKMVR